MTNLHKAGLALVVLAALGTASAARAADSLNVTETTGGTTGAFTFSYAVKPLGFNANTLDFTFSDTNVSFTSDTGPLSITNLGSGSFVASGGTLNSGATETFVFASPDAPQGGLLNLAGTGRTGSASASPQTGPGTNPVPEASTTVSFGLLLMLGMGGLVVSARKKKLMA